MATGLTAQDWMPERIRKTNSPGSNTTTLISNSTRAARSDRSSNVSGFWIQIHFSHFGVGTHRGGLAPERNREHSIWHQLLVLNVGIMERLRSFGGGGFDHVATCRGLSRKYSMTCDYNVQHGKGHKIGATCRVAKRKGFATTTKAVTFT